MKNHTALSVEPEMPSRLTVVFNSERIHSGLGTTAMLASCVSLHIRCAWFVAGNGRAFHSPGARRRITPNVLRNRHKEIAV
jgi:hypothetical protein